jgi:2-hydroxy-3-keto-5-methylthiopentenyl-1-phosphate phosphatase
MNVKDTKRRKKMAKMASLYEEMTRPTEEPELCEYCGDTVDDCIDAGECNYGIADDNCSLCRFECNCDAKYETYKEQEASDYFDSL